MIQFEMIRYEMKKIFSKSMNKTALLVLAAALIIVSKFTIDHVEYVDENGNASTGFAAAKNLRNARNQWAGFLTEDVLSKVIKENDKINASKEALSEDFEEQDKAFAKKQGFLKIRELISEAFSEFDDYDYFKADSISAEEVRGFYDRRITALQEWLDSGKERFSEAEKEFLVKQYENLDTPFYYEYEDGWEALLQNISTFILIVALVIGFFTAGIFSDEFQLKADAVFFSSKLGRNQAVFSKVSAGFLITTVFYAASMLLYTGIVLMVLGADGAGCPVQLDMQKCVYPVTFSQAYLLIAAGGYVGTLFAVAVSMLVSAKIQSTAAAVIVPFIILCLFPFLSRIITLPGAAAFFPDQLLEIYIHMRYFILCEAGGKVSGSIFVIIPVYSAVCVVLWSVLHGVYARTESK